MRQTHQLNWAGGIMHPGEGYGGRPENIPERCPPVLGALGDAPKRDRREAICEADVAAIFGNGPLTKIQAVRQLQAETEASRAACYRALDDKGRFAGHLRFEKGKVLWR